MSPLFLGVSREDEGELLERMEVVKVDTNDAATEWMMHCSTFCIVDGDGVFDACGRDTVMGLFGIAGRSVFEVESAKGGCGGGSGGIAGMVKGDDGSVMVEGVLNEL